MMKNLVRYETIFKEGGVKESITMLSLRYILSLKEKKGTKI